MKVPPALSLLLRIGVSAGMIGLLLWRAPDVDLHQLVPRWTAASTAWLAVAAGLTLLNLGVSLLGALSFAVGGRRPSVAAA